VSDTAAMTEAIVSKKDVFNRSAELWFPCSTTSAMIGKQAARIAPPRPTA
jgi:hypothetical protein